MQVTGGTGKKGAGKSAPTGNGTHWGTVKCAFEPAFRSELVRVSRKILGGHLRAFCFQSLFLSDECFSLFHKKEKNTNSSATKS